ncbi:MAG: hypothetical protein [Caudoviricetes sp.]|nr:MAG: hypothetical protein [Caudoviricetes sp.]
MSRDMIVEASCAMTEITGFLGKYSTSVGKDEIIIKPKDIKIPFEVTLTYNPVLFSYDVWLQSDSGYSESLYWTVSDFEIEFGMNDYEMSLFVNWLDLSIFNFARRLESF